jgi:hypothetical protein
MMHVAFRIRLVTNTPFDAKAGVKPAGPGLADLRAKTGSISGVQCRAGIYRSQVSDMLGQ